MKIFDKISPQYQTIPPPMLSLSHFKSPMISNDNYNKTRKGTFATMMRKKLINNINNRKRSSPPFNLIQIIKIQIL